MRALDADPLPMDATPMPDADDPRQFPDPRAATVESARLHALAAQSQAAQGAEATGLDRRITEMLAELLSPGGGQRLADALASAPSAAIHRHLWRLLTQCERGSGGEDALGVTVFALPLVIVAGIEGEQAAQATLAGVLHDPAGLGQILRLHGALAGNQTLALANALVATHAIDIPQLPEIMSWRALPLATAMTRSVAPAPIVLQGGPESVHLRFLLGGAIAAANARLLDQSHMGAWGMPLAQALARQLAVPGVSLLALPRAPQTLLQAVREGRAAQREVGAQLFASNAIRKLRAAVGEPTAVISAHRAPDATGGGEIRLSLSSPFDPREAEGLRCPLYPLDRVGDVVAMLTELLRECRVTDVRVIPGVHGDRHPETGLPLLFKGDDVPAQAAALH